ncbi:hypothetical protein DPMN_154089 [Dreissena polymorpha]|uniref:Uncharacterized protein n=1 Tax=Dreissena polymorpha TaxID=45954 RepID=A0A9D4FPA2_DREPO|nr:hypothetical protein DPMN_154089 [Dreissena polymorpha]
MSNRSKRDTKTIIYKKFNTSGMAHTGEQRLKIEKSTEVTQLEATAAEVNKHGVLQLLEDDDIDEDELSSMKEELKTSRNEKKNYAINRISMKPKSNWKNRRRRSNP